MGYFKLEKMVHDIMSELKSLFNGNFDSRILTREVKDEICEKIKTAGYRVIGGCSIFELMEKMIRVQYVYFEDKITLLLNIPMESHRKIDNFKLYKLYSLPIKVDNSSFSKGSN